MDQRLTQSDKQMHVLTSLARHYKNGLNVYFGLTLSVTRLCCERPGAHLSSLLIDRESLQTSLSAQESLSGCDEP